MSDPELVSLGVKFRRFLTLFGGDIL